MKDFLTGLELESLGINIAKAAEELLDKQDQDDPEMVKLMSESQEFVETSTASLSAQKVLFEENLKELEKLLLTPAMD